MFTTTDTLDDAQIAQLHKLYQGEWWSRDRTPPDITRMLDGCDHILAIVDGPQLAAFGRILTDGVYKAFVFDVIVAPEYRGRGLGARLMDQILEHPKLSQVEHIELYCLPEMIPFYEKSGFSAEVGGVKLMRRGKVG